MINAKEQKVEKFMKFFERMDRLTSNEITWIWDYLTQEADDQILENLTFRDMSGIPEEQKISMAFYSLVDKGELELAERLGKVFFALGQSTSSELFPNWLFFHYAGQKHPFFMAPEIEMSILVNKINFSPYQINASNMQIVLNAAKKDLTVIEKAISYQKGQNKSGTVILLAIYFLAKYPKLESEDKIKEAKLAFSSQDIKYMELYENILAEYLPDICKNMLSTLDKKALMNALNQNWIDQNMLKTVRNYPIVSHYLFCSVGCMSFLNYHLSVKLKNILTLCLAMNTKELLGYMYRIDMRNDFAQKGGDFDEIFEFPSKEIIAWAASSNNPNFLEQEKIKKILKTQFKKNQKIFMEYMNSADFDVYNHMDSVIQQVAPELHKERQANGIGRQHQQENIIKQIIKLLNNASSYAVVTDYLCGETDIKTLYAYEDDLDFKNRYWGNMNKLGVYEQRYGTDDFCSRCKTFMMLSRMLTYSSFITSGNIDSKKIKDFFLSADTQGLDLKYQINSLADILDSFYEEHSKTVFQKAAEDIFEIYLKDRREEMIAAFKEAPSAGRNFGLGILAKDTKQNKDVILEFVRDSAKSVKGSLLAILYKQKDWKEDIICLLSSKKATEREVAICVLDKWGEEYKPLLAAAYEKEKNAKIRALLENVLHIEKEDAAESAGEENLMKELLKKKRTLAWAYATPFSKVHKKDGTEASDEYLQAICLCYSSMGKYGISQSAASLADALKPEELAVYVNELFDKWLEAGAESKKRWVLYAAAIHGGTDIVKKLHHHIQEWPQASRGAIAAEAVQALALNPNPQALLIVDGIARKFKFKQIKAAAGKALEFAACQLGITTEELADRIVPDLGFDENMERCFDYGTRKFFVTITTALEVEVFSEDKKRLKSLPAPGKRDDAEKAAAAYAEFKQLKKQLKDTVNSQKERLDIALATGRKWKIEAWENLFVKNPIMHQFAINLIWGVYEKGELIQSFRYMEDGSFNTAEEEEYTLPQKDQKDSFIGLVHPIELSKELTDTWRQQLEDYEIIQNQPIEQINRPVYYRTKEEENSKRLERVGGCILNDLSLGGKLTALGWYRGSVQDAGGFYTYYREDPELSLGVELHFSGSYVGSEGEEVTVYDARFYKAGSIERGSYVYDEADDKKAYFLKDIPERYFSEVVLQLTKAVSSSKERDENWKKNQR